MKKVNIYCILRDHLSTLKDDRTGRTSKSDLIFFYAFPLALGALFSFSGITLPNGLEGALIAVFSVFAALLFSAQIALYSLSPTTSREVSDPIGKPEALERARREKAFFRDVNYNVSYLILLSCLFLILFIVLMVANAPVRVEGGLLVAAVSHFFLSLLMLVKRSHVAFALRHTENL